MTKSTNRTQMERVRTSSRSRRDRHKARTRQVILDATAKLLLDEGHGQLSMRRVAERIGYSATTIYRYFADKDALVFAVVDRGFGEFERTLATAAASTDDPVGRLGVLAGAYVEFGRRNPAYYQLMFMHRSDYLAGVPEGRSQPRAAALQTLERAVEAAVLDGALKPGSARTLSHTLWATVHGIVALSITMPQLKAFDSDADLVIALGTVLDGLRR